MGLRGSQFADKRATQPIFGNPVIFYSQFNLNAGELVKQILKF
jgi:hypothetical protein